MPRHEIEKIALAYVKCSCGWNFRQFEIKNKSDEELAAEMKGRHEDHQIDMES